MPFLNPEQKNASRQCVRNGEWIESLKIATGPLRSSLYRMRRSLARRKKRVATGGPERISTPNLTAEILPLFVPRSMDLSMAAGIEPLFRDVDSQIRGEFRLAGAGNRKIDFNSRDRFPEVEDRHGLDRLYWAARYAKAAAFGHSRAMDALKSDLQKWQLNPHTPETFASYTLAERIASLSECLFWLGHCSTSALPDEIISMKRLIWNDAQRLSSNIEYQLGIHNHLLNDARGLFRAARVFADRDQAAAWRAQALRLWDEYFPKLILPDGTFAEQSSHYQILLCRTALEYVLAARLAHHTLPDGAEGNISSMFGLADELLRPDGSLPRFGDNSPDHTIEDLWGLMAAAYYYGLLKTRPRHRAVTPLTLLYCGEAPAIVGDSHCSRHSSYPRGGFMFLRSKDGSVDLTAHADPRPETRAHGDASRGSFELTWRGQPIVWEPGSILSSSNPRSAGSRDGLTHNGTSLNGLAAGVTQADRRLLPQDYAQQGGAWVASGTHEIRFHWDGFQRIRPGIAIWRTWRFNASDDLLMEERIDGSGKVQFESRLHLGDGAKLNRRESPIGPELHWSEADSSVAAHLDLPRGIGLSIEEGRCFPEFGLEMPCPVLVLRGMVTLPIRWALRWHFHAAVKETSAEVRQQCVG